MGGLTPSSPLNGEHTPVAALDFGPPPRVVRWRRVNLQVAVARYLFTPVIVVMLAVFLTMIAVAAAGTRSDGKFTGFRVKTISNGTTTHFAQYMFDLDGQHYESEQRIFSHDSFPWTPGRSVIVRSANLFGYRYSTLADGWGDLININPWSIYGVVVIFVFGFPAVVFRGWLKPARQRRILREGAITTGTISDLPPGPQFTCKYEYADAAGATHKSSTRISPMLALRMRTGDPLTIAYNPARPARHVVCEFSDFEIVYPAR